MAANVQFSPELRLLLFFARPLVAAPEAVPEGAGLIDWDRFLRLATKHRLLPLVSRAAADRGRLPAAPAESGLFPAAVVERMAALSKANATRSLRYGAELIRIVEGAAAVGVSVVPLKGPVWAQELYGDLATRQFSDLDVLVRFEDLEATETVLAGLGYEPAYTAETRGWRPPLHARHDLVFRQPKSNLLLELHWRLARARDDFRLDTEDVFTRARTVDFVGRQVLVPSPEDLFLYLVVHAANHGWGSLEHLRGLGEIVTKNPDVDWESIAERGGHIGARRRALAAVILLSGLGAAFPRAVQRAAHMDAAAESIAAHARATWDEETLPSAGDLAQLRLRMVGLDRFGVRIRYGMSQVFEPDEADWGVLSLPDVLYPLYHVVRPIRLAERSARRGWGRIATRVTRGPGRGPGHGAGSVDTPEHR
jgi:hypothetical protein